MATPEHTIEMRVDGKRHAGIMSADLTLSIDDIAPRWSVQYAERSDPDTQTPWYLEAGDFVELLIDDEVATDGFVFSTDSSEAAGMYTHSAGGSTPGKDIVDSSCITRPTRFTRKTIAFIAESLLDKFAVRLVVDPDVSTEPIARFKFDRGAHVYETLAQAAQKVGAHVFYEPGGVIRLGTIERQPATIGIQGTGYGGVTHISRSVDHSQRFASYHFCGSTRETDDVSGKATAIRNDVLDPGITRHRPMRVQKGQNSGGRREIGARALYERNVRAGKSERVKVTLDRWTNADGRLWRPNTRLRVDAPRVGLDGADLLITSVSYALRVNGEGSRGYTTALELTPPEAYLPDADFPQRLIRQPWR